LFFGRPYDGCRGRRTATRCAAGWLRRRRRHEHHAWPIAN